MMSTTDYRELCFEHHTHECANCGSTTAVEVHHRDGDRTNNNADNLIPLCRGCHRMVHSASSEMPELVRELGKTPRDNSEKTTLSISKKLADSLYTRKNRRETYEDVVWRLIEEGADE